MRRTRASLLVCGALMLLARPSTSAPADDGTPAGMVAFFAAAKGCPDGWSAADEAAGRFVVGANAPSGVGRSIGTALADQEDRKHSHGFAANTTVPTRNVAALDGGNNQAAQPAALTTLGTTSAGRSGLPFVQLVVCKKL